MLINFILSTGGRSQSQMVSIQNINSFLTKNKDLAKALGIDIKAFFHIQNDWSECNLKLI